MNWQSRFLPIDKFTQQGVRSMLDNLKLSLIILLTGIVVVFAVLVLLIIIIKLYSMAVSSAQSSIEQKKVEKTAQKTDTEEIVEKAETAKAEESDDGSIPGEIIAAIAAAVEVIFGEGAVKVSSVKRAKPVRTSKRRSAWKAAGIAENTRAF